MPRRGRRWRRRRNRGSGSRQGHSLQVHTVAGMILRGKMGHKRAESNAEALATRLLGHNAAPVGSQGRATRASVTRLPGRGTRGWRGRIGGGIGVPSARIDQTKSYFGRGFWVGGHARSDPQSPLTAGQQGGAGGHPRSLVLGVAKEMGSRVGLRPPFGSRE